MGFFVSLSHMHSHKNVYAEKEGEKKRIRARIA
jgi:hypothetical protein